MNNNMKILRNLILGGSIYFTIVAIVYLIGIKIPLFYIYFDILSFEYQDRIISFLAFGWAVFFFSAYKISAKNIDIVKYIIVACAVGVTGLVLNNIRTDFEIITPNANIWFYWIETFALFIYLLNLIIFYLKALGKIKNLMKNFMKILPIILCSLIMAAHLGRANMFVLQIVSLLIPFFLFWKNKISARTIQLFLILYGFEWIRTIFYYARMRTANGEDWSRLAIILGVVALLNFATTLVFRSKSMKERYGLE